MDKYEDYVSVRAPESNEDASPGDMAEDEEGTWDVVVDTENNVDEFRTNTVYAGWADIQEKRISYSRVAEGKPHLGEGRCFFDEDDVDADDKFTSNMLLFSRGKKFEIEDIDPIDNSAILSYVAPSETVVLTDDAGNVITDEDGNPLTFQK